MFDVLGSLRAQLLKHNRVVIDNLAFRMHYRLTSWILIAFSILVSSRQYFGDPIDCMSYSSAISDKIWNQYCWMSTTFTLPYSGEDIGTEVPHPGLDTSIKGQDRVYHQYYQWVCFTLFLQAIMFAIPHFLWKLWEGGKLKTLSTGLEFTLGTEPDKLKDVVKYLKSSRGQHNFYFIKHVICELANLLNVIGQLYLTDKFLGGYFLTYGTEVISYSETNQENRLDPMVKVFPRVTKCIFNTFGPSGDVQKHDALCVLPINIINEKIYIFLWFWFIIVAILSGLAILYRFLLIIVPRLRAMQLTIQARLTESVDVKVVTNESGFGDWFLLHQLGESIDSDYFDVVIQSLARSEKYGF